MAIKFICSCGKRLRARDEMAARRSMCPRCGAPVGVPSLRPTHAGTTAAPLTPQERRRLSRERGEDPFAPPPVDTVSTEEASAAPPPSPPPRRLPWLTPSVRRPRHLETRWYQCLIFPLLNCSILLPQGFLLAQAACGLVLFMPALPRFAAMTPKQWLPYSPALLIPLLMLAFICWTVECALTSALAGQGPAQYWLERRILVILKSGLRWLICFLAGPAALLALAGYFWLYGGELTKLDYAIVGELVALAVAYWFLAVVASAERDRLRDANPLRVAWLLHRLRFRAAVPLLVVPAAACLHGLVFFFALEAVHRHFSAWLLLTACSISGLFCLTFLFRLLGVWCYRLEDRAITDPAPAPAAAAH